MFLAGSGEIWKWERSSSHRDATSSSFEASRLSLIPFTSYVNLASDTPTRHKVLRSVES
jgi:hypothetical protein